MIINISKNDNEINKYIKSIKNIKMNISQKYYKISKYIKENQNHKIITIIKIKK